MQVLKGQPGCGEAIVRSTQQMPMRMRSAYWRDAVSMILPSLAVDYAADEPPRAQLESRPFADARVSRFIDNTIGCHITHTPSRLSWTDAYLLVLQVEGSGSYQHAGQEIILDSGDLVLLDMARRFDLRFPKGHHELVWELRRDTLAPLLTAPEVVGVRISGDHGFGALLASSVRTLAVEAGGLDEASQRALRLHLCNLAALTIGATLPVREARHETYRMTRRQQILAYIEAHLREDNLTAGRAARDLKMSRRWLHELFSNNGTSFAAWIARRRVEECRKLLEDPESDGQSISEIAFGVGFNDLSTFNRHFRARYSVSPRDVRRGSPSADEAS